MNVGDSSLLEHHLIVFVATRTSLTSCGPSSTRFQWSSRRRGDWGEESGRGDVIRLRLLFEVSLLV